MKYFGFILIAGILSGCSNGFAGTSIQTYCLEEQERNGFDYMVVTDYSACDLNSDDVEIYETDAILRIGDIAYVEFDGNHSKSKVKSKDQVKSVPNAPTLTPANPTVKICPKANYKPAPPAPKPPAPAPVAPKPQPAPVVPKPAPAPIVPKVPAPTFKPGC